MNPKNKKSQKKGAKLKRKARRLLKAGKSLVEVGEYLRTSSSGVQHMVRAHQRKWPQPRIG